MCRFSASRVMTIGGRAPPGVAARRVSATLGLMSTFENDLRAALDGEVDFSVRRRGEYSYDASVYRRVPLGVVFPRSEEDVAAAVRVAREHGVPLTTREIEVVRLSLSGFSTRAIAERLTISFETVRAHKRHIYAKLGVSSQSELFALFYESGARDDR